MLNKQMEHNIRNYGNEIVTKLFPDNIRVNIGMYIGSKGNQGYLNMIREVFQNAFDEIMRATRGKSPCTIIRIFYDERTYDCMIQDDGRGLPFEKMHDIYAEMSTSSNYEKELGDYSSGKHGLGGKITNALCDKFSAESYQLGEARKIEFDNAISKKGIYVISNKDKLQGTLVSFHPSMEIMGNISLKCEEVLEMMRGIVFLGRLGKIVEFHGISLSGKRFETTIVNEDGILTDIYHRVPSPLITPIAFSGDDGYCKADIALTYDSEDISGVEDIHSYANYSPTTDGTHVKGFKEGVEKFFSDYMNKIYLAKAGSLKGKKSKSNSKPLQVIGADVRYGLRAIVSACALIPIFGGQAKETITNEELKPYVKDLVIKSLELWAKEKPMELNKVCNYLKDVATKRTNDDKEKIKLVSKYKTDALSGGLPKKYVRPQGTKDLEFIIVEGDSAGGSGKNTRCKARQGILPIKGKMPNIFKMTSKNRREFLENDEIAAIINIISDGTGKYGENFMPSDTRYVKIIIMPDSDKDGAHIAVLVLKIFMVLYPRLVEAGMVYRAIAPLYGIPNSRNKDKIDQYFTTRFDYTEWMYKNFSKSNVILKPDKSKLSNAEAEEILYKNSDYIYDMNVFSNRYAIDPILLEQVIFKIIEADRKKKELYNFMKKSIEADKRFRFIKVNNENSIITIKGEFNELIQTIILNRVFMNDLEQLLQHVANNVLLSFILNDKLCSLYELVSKFEKSAPSHIIRYKGLGQMNAKQLQCTTLHPDMDRTLIRYNVVSASEYITKMRALETDKCQLLVGRTNSREDIMD